MKMITRTIFFLAAFLASVVLADDDDCIEKPCGPLVCQARCVASCLDTSLASTVAECSNKFCDDYNDKTLCALNDTQCWKTCGIKEYSDDKPAPPKIDDLHLLPWSDGYSSTNANPNSIRIEWPVVAEASLYLVEIFPMLNEEPDDLIIRNMTTETIFSFERTDICDVYMIRVMSVNGFGNSAPRYLIVDAWKPNLNFDENFDVRGMLRDGDYLKVLIDYTQPETWHQGDVELENSFVRAHECLGPIDSELFMNTEPDEDGFYTPLVFINETGSNIELSFPSKIMHSKCLYSYRISTLRTRCNVTNQLDPKTGAGVDFSINCQSVEDSDCSPENIAVSTPEASTTTPESKEVVAKANSKEVIIGINGDAIRELEQESTTTAQTTESGDVAILAIPEALKELAEEKAASTTPKSESGEMAILALPEALKELEEEKAATTPIVVDTTGPRDSQESAEPMSPPSPFGGDNDAPPPVIVIIEPRDPNAPQCKLTEFDASVDIKTDGEEPSADLSISWTEDKSGNGMTPNHFLIRYGPVLRTLIVDAEPDIIDETILRNPSGDSSSSSEETTRLVKVTDLLPNGLYAFQICAIYNPDATPGVAWDTAPRYIVDISASGSDLSATTPVIAPDSAEQMEKPNSNGTMDFVDYFVEALNASFSGAQEAAVATETGPDTDETVKDPDMGILLINLPEQPPPILMIDVKPVVVADSSSWSPVRALWLLIVLGLLAITVSAFMFFIVKRSRNRRRGLKTHEKFDTAPIYYTQTTVPVASDVKIPIS